MPAEVGELRVGLEADLALEGLDAAVDVLVLLQATRGRKRLAALGAGVRSGAHVVGADVALQVAGVSEHLITVLTGKVTSRLMGYLDKIKYR